MTCTAGGALSQICFLSRQRCLSTEGKICSKVHVFQLSFFSICVFYCFFKFMFIFLPAYDLTKNRQDNVLITCRKTFIYNFYFVIPRITQTEN